MFCSKKLAQQALQLSAVEQRYLGGCCEREQLNDLMKEFFLLIFTFSN